MYETVTKISILILLLFILANHPPSLSSAQDDDSAKTSYLTYVDGSGCLYQFNSDFSVSEQLTDCQIVRHSWSPDGTRLSYSSYSAVSNINILNIVTMEESQITFSDAMTPNDAGTFIQNINPVWSPDGTMIAFSSNRDSNWEVYVIVLETMEEYRLTNNDVADGYDGLTWMPDSSGVAFVRDEDIHFNEETQTYEEMQIYLANIHNLGELTSKAELMNLTSNVHICNVGEVYYNPTWSVNNQLAFALSCGGGDFTEIYLMDMTSEDSIDNPTLVNLTKGEIDALALGYHELSWNCAGTSLSFTGIVDDDSASSEIFVLDINTNATANEYSISQITDSPTDTRYLSLSWKPTIPC